MGCFNILTNHVRTVVLVVRFAVGALHAGLNLGTNTNAVSNFASCDVFANCDDLANDLVSNAQRSHRKIAPTSGDSVNV